MKEILIIDDEEGIRSVLSDILSDEGYQVTAREDGDSGIQALTQKPFDVILLDIWLPKKGGIDVLKEIKEEYPLIEVVMISGHANIDMAVSAIKMGAFDFLQKPLSLERVITVVNNALHLEELKKENRDLKRRTPPKERLLGNSPGMERIHKLISQSANSDARILITGENGTGKELAAREIHDKGSRADKPFIEVNCAAIPDPLIESELFGHEKGSFTGAVSSRKGQFEIAHNGTLFLDEIADMSLSAQAKVLRAIQEQTIQRVGGESFIHVNLRIIAATNKDLQNEVKEGRFREDLFFRLNVIPLRLPPLRERPEDIPLLAARFMEIFQPPGEETPRKLSEEAGRRLQRHTWPGNVRELKNFIERLTIMTDEAVYSPETVETFLETPAFPQEDMHSITGPEYTSMTLSDAKEAFETEFIRIKLAENRGNISQTAQVLGISPSSLHGKIKKFGLGKKT